jgi:molybdopterin-containing oxidoreductase family iron-sulfur binding subunit
MRKKKTRIKLELTRKDFLIVGGTAAGSIIAAQLLTTGPLSPFASFKQEQVEGLEEAVTEEQGHHWGMLINLDKCIGCEYCLRACSATNDVWVDPDLERPEKPWNIVAEEKTSTGTSFFFTRPCLHCADAPCVEVCPVQATYHRDDGLVVMNYSRCIGCRYCEIACPYDARKFNWQARTDVNPYIPTWGIAEVNRRPRGVVEKCTFCIHRIDAGLKAGFTPGEDREATPACVNICPVGARIFGDMNDPESIISQAIASEATTRLREELGTEPSVYYVIPKEGL